MKVRNRKSGAELKINKAQWEKLEAKGNDKFYEQLDVKPSKELVDQVEKPKPPRKKKVKEPVENANND